MLRIVHAKDALFSEVLSKLAVRGASDLAQVQDTVRAIIQAVRAEGDQALIQFASQFEKRVLKQVSLADTERKTRAATLAPKKRELLAQAAERIERYHRHQLDKGFSYTENGITLGLRVRPVAAAGVYAPGGKASYPSTVLMTAIPAKVAGVKRIVLASPNPCAEVLAAAEIAGVTEVIDVGGAQAIAALAYGTQSIASVDKIVGPGNLYVACAKKLVAGDVAIDSIAGPSEILIVADDNANPHFVAADLLSQAEHDEAAYPLAITLSEAMATQINASLAEQLATLSRRAIAEVSCKNNGLIMVAQSRAEAASIASALASEHLSLQVDNPREMADHIDRAGAIFLGAYTPETAGDYAAGPSHVLPTGGSARFSSPLGVYDFITRTSMIEYNQAALREQASLLTDLAELEGLEAHARAVTVRIS